MIYDLEAENTIVLTQTVQLITGKYLPYYGSVEDADNYFDHRLHADDWMDADYLTKKRALADASQRIDVLNFVGQRAASDQYLAFPRKGQTIVPNPILHAVYEVALILLKGIDPDTEANNLSATSRAYAGVRTDYDRSFVPLYTRNGIPSQTAWTLLFPWLRPWDTAKLSRSS